MLPITYQDCYKISNSLLNKPGTTMVYSNLTPRKFMDPKQEYTTIFGVQYMIKRYFIEEFNQWFSMSKEEAVLPYKRYVEAILGRGFDVSHIDSLHSLGYLPLHIKTLDEGTKVPAGIPVLTITNTLPEFYWLVNFLETLISNTLWYPSTMAARTKVLKDLMLKYANETCDDNSFVDYQLCDFSLRGHHSNDSGTVYGGAWATSFKGSDTFPAMMWLEKYYNANINETICSVTACFPDDAEVLTENGFKRFYDLDMDEKVAQYHENGEIDFVVPTHYHEYDYDGYLEEYYSTNNSNIVAQKVTPNHRVVYRTQNHTKVLESKDFIPKNHNYFIVSGFNISGKNDLTNEDKLMIAFQADGSFSSRSNQYTGLNNSTIPIRFGLKKERKAERLTTILDNLGYEYSKNKYDNGYYSFRVKVPMFIKLSKVFDWINLSEVSSNWCKEFVEELQFWDGNKPKENIIIYSSTEKINIDTVQAICAISGKKTTFNKYEDLRKDCNRKPIYSTCINIDKTEISISKVDKRLETYKGKVYCVSVPSGMIITRQNNLVVISGNSEHATAGSFGPDEELDYTRHMIESVPSNAIVSIVADTWNYPRFVTKILPQLKDLILSREGKVVIRPDSFWSNPQDCLCGYDGWHEKMNELDDEEIEMVRKGTVQTLYEMFGGTKNNKGYVQVNPSISVIYGEALFYDRLDEICSRLKEKGFASNNFVGGIGSYSSLSTSTCGITRDINSWAIKCVAVANADGLIEVFKDPVTDSGSKKSLKGLLKVYEEDGIIKVKDQCTREEEKEGLLETVFLDGKLVKETTLSEIRSRLND